MRAIDVRGLISNNLSFLGFIPPGRSIKVFESDIFIVSYPKSGNTWLRFLIGNLIYNEDQVLFSNIEEKIPDIYQNSGNFFETFSKAKNIKKSRIFRSKISQSYIHCQRPKRCSRILFSLSRQNEVNIRNLFIA